MRLLRLVLLLALAVTISAGALRAQDGDTAPRPFSPIPKGQNEIRYTDPSQIPPQLMQAIKEAWCNPEHEMRQTPIHVFEIEKSRSRRTVALEPCFGIAVRSKAFIFDRPTMQSRSPQPMAFPVIDVHGGIGMSFAPGYLTWDETNQVLHARLGSDLCPSPALRYTYRFEPQDRQDAPLSWVLLKAEIDRNGCGNPRNQWEPFWEAPTLSDREMPR